MEGTGNARRLLTRLRLGTGVVAGHAKGRQETVNEAFARYHDRRDVVIERGDGPVALALEDLRVTPADPHGSRSRMRLAAEHLGQARRGSDLWTLNRKHCHDGAIPCQALRSASGWRMLCVANSTVPAARLTHGRTPDAPAGRAGALRPGQRRAGDRAPTADAQHHAGHRAPALDPDPGDRRDPHPRGRDVERLLDDLARRRRAGDRRAGHHARDEPRQGRDGPREPGAGRTRRPRRHRRGPAADTLRGLPGPFDFVFLDADRGNYLTYLELVVPKLVPRGLLVADNVVSHAGELQDYLASA